MGDLSCVVSSGVCLRYVFRSVRLAPRGGNELWDHDDDRCGLFGFIFYHWFFYLVHNQLIHRRIL